MRADTIGRVILFALAMMASTLITFSGMVAYLHVRIGLEVRWTDLLLLTGVGALALQVILRLSRGYLRASLALSMPLLLLCGFMATTLLRRLLNQAPLTLIDWISLFVSGSVLITSATLGEIKRRRRAQSQRPAV